MNARILSLIILVYAALLVVTGMYFRYAPREINPAQPTTLGYDQGEVGQDIPTNLDKFYLEVSEGYTPESGKSLTTVRVIPDKELLSDSASFIIRGDFSGLENFCIKIIGPNGEIIYEIYEKDKL